MKNELTNQRNALKQRLSKLFLHASDNTLCFRDFNMLVNNLRLISDIKSFYFDDGVRITLMAKKGLEIFLNNITNQFNIVCKILDGTISTNNKTTSKDTSINGDIKVEDESTIMLTFKKI